MSRYIDADNFYTSQAARCWGEPIIGTCTSDKALLYDELQKLPISDVVEVIRCKDCKHYHQFTSFCEKNSYFYDDNGLSCSPADSPCWTMFADNDFCSYGVRKDGETNDR